jgi:NADP-reducing hydrogenase subunit HndB
MKSLKELEEIRKKTLDNINLRKGREGYRVVVGMATCGIAAGAREVLTSTIDEIKELALTNVTVAQTGCIGVCRLEPIVEVYSPNGEKVTYIKMDSQKAKAMVQSHIKNDKVIDDYTMTVIEGKVVDPAIKK